MVNSQALEVRALGEGRRELWRMGQLSSESDF